MSQRADLLFKWLNLGFLLDFSLLVAFFAFVKSVNSLKFTKNLRES